MAVIDMQRHAITIRRNQRRAEMVGRCIAQEYVKGNKEPLFQFVAFAEGVFKSVGVGSESLEAVWAAARALDDLVAQEPKE